MAFNNKDNKYYGYIYKITNIKTNKLYIGQTRRTIDIRWNQHLLEAQRNKYTGGTVLYKSMNKHGVENFKIEIIKEYSSENKSQLVKILDEEEINYIIYYNTIIPNGYNMQRGGKSATESLKRPVDKYSLDGILLNSYESISSACEESEVPLNRVHIAECCDGKLYTSYGFVWRDKGEPFNKYKDKDKRICPVSKYTTDNIFIKQYDSMKNAIYDTFGTTNHKKYSSHIASCCKGKAKTAYGYIWKYAS